MVNCLKLLMLATVSAITTSPVTKAAFDDVKRFSADIKEVAGALEATIDLGVVPAGQKIKAVLELKNNLPFELPIQQMKTTCKCVQVRSQSSTIPKEGVANLDLEFTVPNDADSPESTSVFWIHYAQDATISVYLKASMSGMVCFKNSVHFHTKVPRGQRLHQFKIPVLITDPAKVEDVKVVLDSLGHIKTDLENDQSSGTQWLNCSVPIDADSKTMLGAIRLENKSLGKQSTIQVVIEVVSGVEIVPRVMRFSYAEEKIVTANAIVKIDKSLLRLDEGQGKELPVEIDFTRNGKPVASDVMRIGTGVYRVKIRCQENKAKEFLEDFGTLACSVNTGKTVLDMKDIGVKVE